LLYNQRVSYVSGIRRTRALIKKHPETNPLDDWAAVPEQFLWELAATILWQIIMAHRLIKIVATSSHASDSRPTNEESLIKSGITPSFTEPWKRLTKNYRKNFYFH